MTPHYWLSFATEDDNLGCVVVQPTKSDFIAATEVRFKIFGKDFENEGDRAFVAAIACSHRLGINPGGEVAGAPLRDHFVPDPEWRNRLLSPEKALPLIAEMKKKTLQ